MRDEINSGIIKTEDTFKPFEHHVYTVLKIQLMDQQHLYFNMWNTDPLFKKNSSFSWSWLLGGILLPGKSKLQ